MLVDPVWRVSPWVLWRYPQLVIGVLAGSFSLALAVLSGPVLVAASGTAAFGAVVDAVPDAANARERPLVRGVLVGVSSPVVEDEVSERVGGLPAAGELVVTRRPFRYRDFSVQPRVSVTNPETGVGAVAVPFSATGAVDGLVPVGDASVPGGVWVPDVVADEIDVGAGDEVAFSVDAGEAAGGAAEVSVTVAGVYATVAGDAVPEDGSGVWAALGDQLPAWPFNTSRPTVQVPMLVAERAVFDELLAGVGEVPLTVWEVGLASETIADAQRLANGAQRLGLEAFDPASDLRGLIDEASGGESALEVFSGIGELAAEARAARAETADGVSSVRVIGVAVSALVVALASAAMAWRRRDERQALVDAGRSPWELAGLATVEVSSVAAAGVTGAVWVLPSFVSAIVGTAGPAPSTSTIVAVGAATIALVGVVSALDAWRLGSTSSGRAEEAARRVPWRVVVVAIAAVVAVPVFVDDESGFTALSAVFPIAALVALAVGVGGLFTTVAAGVRRVWRSSPLVARLLVARSSRDRAVAAAVMATTVAFGAVSYTVLSAEAVAEASLDKATAQAGSNATVRIPTARLVEDTGVPDASTVVWRLPTINIDDGRGGVLAVDPATFLDGALWSPSFADVAPAAVMSSLAESDEQFVAVVTNGSLRAVPTRGVLSRNGFDDIAYRVVERVAAVPGGFEDRPTLLVDSVALFERAGAGASPVVQDLSAVDPDGSFTTEVWSQRPIAELTAALAAIDVPFEQPAALAETLAQPTLLARGWTVDYLVTFAAVAAVLGVVVIVGTSLRDRQRRRLQSTTLAELGHSIRTMGWVNVIEVVVIATVGTVAGAMLARPVVASIAGRLDPLPGQAPALTVGAGTAIVAAAGVAFVVAATALSAIGGLRPHRTSINEALRDE